MKTNNPSYPNNNLDNLIGKLKKEDLNYARICRGVQIMYWILIPFFVAVTTIKLVEEWQVLQLISGISYILSFVILIIFFGNYHKEYKYVDYAQPTIKMLKQAAYRYQLLQVKSLWILAALILMDIGLTLSSGIENVWDTQLFLGGAIAFAFSIGVVLWYIKYKPIRDNATRLIREIESN